MTHPMTHPVAHHLPAPGRPVPTATYRLQLSGAFTFADAENVAGHLASLGVSHAYLSPLTQAAPGSTHGYDIVDHTRVSAELGGMEGLRRLLAALRGRRLGAVADVVPNHMAVPVPESLNRPLWSVLRDGPSSAYARWFDIDWEAQGQAVLMPILGRAVSECLAAGEITTGTLTGAGAGADGAEPVVRYYDHVLPVRPGTEGLPLPELLGAQWYRLAYWRVADSELNYRRFFDVNTLAALRVEDPEVFRATHALTAGLVRGGTLDGLRVDHPDGLADPRGYLRRLAEATGGGWVVVEKILTGREELPADWACSGTTGYDAAGMVNGVLVDPAGEGPLTETYQRFTGAPADFAEVAAAAKRQLLAEVLRAEVRRLVDTLTGACRSDPRLGDHTPSGLRAALVELLVALPVYRTYRVPGEEPSGPDVRTVERAAAVAAGRLPAGLRPTLELVRDLALGRYGTGLPGGGPSDGPSTGLHGEFQTRFQQTSAPVMAKGFEDTALYRWSRLLCRNDVGCDPAEFCVPPAAFHGFCARLQRDWPLTLTALSTHDSKRSEDVRARLAVLSELPAEWERAVTGWSERVSGRVDAETEYLLWQTLVGTWPIGTERLVRYLRKAVREAKRHTRWTAPDEEYERRVRTLAERVLADQSLRRSVAAFVRRLDTYGRVNTLGQKLLQLAMPGVPDVYQGSELVIRSLVDPDNRGPVDFHRCRRALARLDAGWAPRDLDEEKLLVTSCALRLRRDRPEAFGADASYRPLPACGPAAACVLAFLRSETVVAVATRLGVSLDRAGGWGTTGLDLPAGHWRDVLTGTAYRGGRVGLVRLLARLPVALLVSEPVTRDPVTRDPVTGEPAGGGACG